MSVDNVYLSVVNESAARIALDQYRHNRIFRNESLYKYKHESMLELARLAGVKQDFNALSANEQRLTWKFVIDYVYGDEIAGLTTTKQTTKKETNMSVTVETKHLVNNTDVTTMTPDDLIRCIKNIEQEIKELKAINIQSNYVLKKVEELGVTLGVVVGHLDAK